ncbi:hypothetical protein [Cryobacterium sp. TMT2-15-1]|uniref:hypothetical protein n=1 Tax=Cryobacterium sp. TMT2-15-1 TaxID=1259246 RepID=UPI001F548228|nr:hypothetical protein [Cryobacterium sp. TMT2-15-1]
MFGDWTVKHAPWNNEELARPQSHIRPALHLNEQIAIYDQEHFVLIVMGMPNKFTEKFRDLDVLVVDLANHTRRPVRHDLFELIRYPRGP